MNKVYALLLFLLVVGAGAVRFVPLRLIQPFRPQTEGEVALAYRLFRQGPWVTLTAFVLGLALFVLLWRSRPSWRLTAPAILMVLALAWLSHESRRNPYTRLFAPIGEPGFVAAAEADHLAPEDLVLGVAVGTLGKAYPVGMLAYHHVVNDEIGGVPVAVTY